MRRSAMVFALLLAGMGILRAEVDVSINLNLGAPKIVFEEEPEVVLAAPGVYVVPDYPEEVFLVSGFYWMAHGRHWYRAKGPHAKWVRMEKRHVPSVIVKLPRGKYKHWRPDDRADVLIGDKGTKVIVQKHSAEPVQEYTVTKKKKSIHAYEHESEIPAGHLPPPGKCRIWYPDREPGHQPPPGDCDKLRKQVPPGARLIQG